VVRIAVTNGGSLKHAAAVVRADPAVCEAAVEANCTAISFVAQEALMTTAPEIWTKLRAIVITTLSSGEVSILPWDPGCFRSDREFVEASIGSGNPSSLEVRWVNMHGCKF